MKKNNFLKYIYYMFNIDINEECVKSAIRMWFGDWSMYDFLRLRILNIKIKTKTNHIKVNILLERPGYLIGKRGDTIKKLEKFLAEFMEMPVKINVTVGDIFRHKNTIYYHNLYKKKR